MVLLKFGRTPLFHSLLWVTFIVSMTEECKASTVKCENGSEVCLSFNVSSVNTPSIRRNNENLCSVFVQGTSPHVFGLSWSNKTINCSLSHSLSEMNLCFGNCQPEDGGNFSLHEDRTPAYPSVQILTLEIISQQYNLTGSSEFAALGESFTWTCEMFLPPGETIFAVYFHRNNIRTVLIVMKDAKCATQSAYSRYSYQCLSGNIFSLTIPAENMTVFEQKSTWRCEYLVNPFYRSPDVILNIAINVHNVSLIPSDDPLTVREGIQKVIQCVVNSDAVPTPTITWYLGSTNITSIEGTYTTSVIITGNRTDNTKTVQCRATNNNKPPKTASTTLNVEYPPTTNNLSQQAIIEGRILSVTCQATPGNPSSTIFYWTKVDNPGFKQNGATLQLYYIRRTSSGTYICTAENTYSNGEKGTDSQSIVVDVQYPQSVNAMSNQNILEGRDLSVNCTATPGNPSYTTFYWTKVDNPGFRQNGPTLQLPNIQRTSSGIYRCTAENDYSNGEKGTDSQSMVVNVLYSPVVNAMSQHNIMEGKNLSVTCQATPGNPSSTTFYWTKVDNSGFRQNGSNIQLYNIQRNNSGTYRCTAENSFSNGQKGTHSQYMVVNVQYSPTIENKSLQTVNESESATLTRNIVSNPLSNASWYDKTQLLKTESSVQTTTFTIENATCTDTKNYTLVASNGVGNMMTAMVELIVNCKPMPDITNITLMVTCTTGIEFSTTIIAYPEPLYELQYENGSRNTQMMNYVTRNALNNFTVHFRQPVVDQSSFDLYYLRMSNTFGESTVIVNVIEQRRRPDKPRHIEVVCEITQATVQWISSFNGGDHQNFTVIILNGLLGSRLSYLVYDKGENKIHVTYISNLQPSVTYWFYVSAKNSHGSSTSDVTSCKTEQEITSSQTGVVVGSIGGALVLVTIVLILGIVVHRHYLCICTCNIAFEKRNRNTTVDTNIESSNYTTIKEQQEHTERNMYDDLTSNENANQYEDILKKENCMKNCKKRRRQSRDSKDDKFVIQNTEEYVNTSFTK